MEFRQDNLLIYYEDEPKNRKKLFEDAIEFAKQGKVLYILHEELNELPELSQDLTLINRHYMKMISFLYAKTLESLMESISTLPEWKSVPSLIILDDLSNYCIKKNMQVLCAIIALLIDAARSCSVTLETPCQLRISITKDKLGEENCETLKELYCIPMY